MGEPLSPKLRFGLWYDFRNPPTWQRPSTPSKERAGRTNEGLEIIRRLWEGETLTFKGKYYEIHHAKLSPAPVQQPRPPLWVGGFTPAAIRRAARYGDGYIGTGPLTGF